MEQTTIRLTKRTKDNLDALKLIPQEPMEQVLKRMLGALASEEAIQTYEVDLETKNQEWQDDEGNIDPKVIRLIKERLESVRLGKVISTKDMRARLQNRKGK